MVTAGLQQESLPFFINTAIPRINRGFVKTVRRIIL